MSKRQYALPPLPGSPAPRTQPQAQHDLLRLAELRDRHQRLLDDYRRASEAVREANAMLVRLRNGASAHPEAAETLRRPGEQLKRLTVERLTELLIQPRTVQQIIAAEIRLAKLTTERDALRADVAQSSAFMEQVERYAKERNLE